MGRARAGLTLDFPMSLGVYDKYDDAQRAVDFLSDHEFPVENCMIVGTDLKQVERVTGRLTTGRVALGGLLSGHLARPLRRPDLLAVRHRATVAVIVSAPRSSARCSASSGRSSGYAATRGRRDFTSVSQVVATRYEVLVEHKHADGRPRPAGPAAGQVTFV